ncbi:MAG: Large-conductance mechanosensitive channel-like protein [Parcubacteria group bacterium]|nr:Large-conductance mechanosensitive channel-like protein [Parcubacteria group bacterium]
MKGFLHFIRTQGVMGLAVGFILGSAAQDIVKSLSSDIITPTIGLATNKIGNLATASSTVLGQTFGWGHFIYSVINLILIAFIIYLAVTRLNITNLDAKKDEGN